MLEAVNALAAPRRRRRRLGAHGRGPRSGSGSPTTSRSSGCTGWSATASATSSWPTTSRSASTGWWRWRRRRPSRPATGRGSRSSRPASSSTCARRRPRTAPGRRRRCASGPRTSPACTSCPGHGVVELLTRATSKARADRRAARRDRRRRASCSLGDDRTDEEVFAALGDGDCSIRVGPGETAARHRLAGPPEVLRFLRAPDRPRLSAALTGAAPPAGAAPISAAISRPGRASAPAGNRVLWMFT